MIAFIDDYRGTYGVEPICKVRPIAPSTWHEHVAPRIDSGKQSARAKRDVEQKPQILRVFDEDFEIYGARKVWRQMLREGFDVAPCAVERLMAELGLQSVSRGKPISTTGQGTAAPRPLGMSTGCSTRRRPTGSGSRTTDVSTWSGFVYVAFVIDAYARRIIGGRVSRTAHASFVHDALEQARHERRPVHRGALVYRSDRGSQYVSIRYTGRLADAGFEPSVGSYDTAFAETIDGLYKAERIHRCGLGEASRPSSSPR